MRAWPLSLAAIAACASAGGGRSAGAECEVVTGSLPADIALAPLAGRFVITLHATGGAQRGNTVTGYVTLRAAPQGTPGPAPAARTAFIGTTDVRLETVGALRLGDTGSDDPRAPGVAIYEQRGANGATTVTGRVGSYVTGAPEGGQVPIESAFTALFVRRIEAGGFAGGWTSGTGRMDGDRSGHFCAVRVE